MKLILMSILMNEMLSVFSDIYIYKHARAHLVVLVHDLDSGSSHVTTGLMMHRKIRTFQKELVGEID